MPAPAAPNVAEELAWRLATWRSLPRINGVARVPKAEVESLQIYSGQAGIYRAADRTSAILEHGVAVSLMHNGRSYDDHLDDEYLLYDFPRTRRSGKTDENEVQSVRNTYALGLPVFVVIKGTIDHEVRLAEIAATDDGSRVFLVKFITGDVPVGLGDDLPDHAPGVWAERRLKTRADVERAERDPKFKFKVLQRYSGSCAVTGLHVGTMLDAAHVIPVSERGSDNPANGLLLSASAHRAFDANLWSVEPESLTLVTNKIGPSLKQMKLEAVDLTHLRLPPSKEALEHRFGQFMKGKEESHVRFGA